MINALLFVFGYRTSKMRQGKLSELIHNSARYSDLDECSVEAHFREIIDLVRISLSSNHANVHSLSLSGQPGPDAYDVVPNSNFVVARTAFKYTINTQMSNFTEVQTLLEGRGRPQTVPHPPSTFIFNVLLPVLICICRAKSNPSH